MPTELKDGLGNEFTMKTKDVSPSQNNSIRQNWHLATRFPVDHSSGGAFYTTMKSNTMAANPAFTSLPIVSFRFASASLICVLRRLELSMWTLVTPFTAGFGSFEAFVARSYTADATGGLVAALAGNAGKLRTSYQSPVSVLRVSDTTPLTPGTRTLDANPFENTIVNVPITPNLLLLNNVKLFEEADHALVLANQEGVIIQATVPASGTWAFNVTAVWDEVEAQNY